MLVAKIQTSTHDIVKPQKFDITYSTAQGSCLGPLLFILFCNDIHLLPIYSHLILFADNITIFNSNKNINLLCYTLEHEVSLFIDWFKANQLLLNLDKTVLIKFWSNDTSFNISCRGLTLHYQ